MTSHHLPPEILEQIFQHIPLGYQGQIDHWACSLVSRSWYASVIKRLYHSPSIIGKNFDAFTNTLCPSVNANIRRTELALFVHRLDMSRLVYSGSKSLTARVLGRVKGQLEVFIAPAATFSLLAFSALAKCHRLRSLNLEYVIERIDAVLLLRTVVKLHNLERLFLRTTWTGPVPSSKPLEDFKFPDSLRHLTVSGVCEVEGALLLYKAMETSKITSLAITLGGEARSELSRAIYCMKLRKLYLDVGPRSTTPGWASAINLVIPDLLYLCREVEELSIPLFCLQNVFFTTSGLSMESAYSLRRLIIHSSSSEMLEPLLQESEWDQLIRNILSGHLQYLEEITVEDRKDVIKFEELDHQMPGRLDQLDQALFDERLERSGLFLAGREDFS